MHTAGIAKIETGLRAYSVKSFTLCEGKPCLFLFSHEKENVVSPFGFYSWIELIFSHMKVHFPSWLLDQSGVLSLLVNQSDLYKYLL